MFGLDVSIIIVNWNTRDLLENCLTSVMQQYKNVDFEVIVIDNASTDGSAQQVKGRFPKVILVENRENRGFATANNQGMKIAKGRYIFLLNSDTVILDRTIENMVRFADAHPDTAVVGCKVLNPDGTLQPTCFMFPSLLNIALLVTYLYKLFPRSRFFGREHMTWWDRNDDREVDVVTGCCMLVRREAIQQVGMMDDRFFMYAEETDWCYRFRRGGWKNMFTPTARIVHYGNASAVRFGPERALLRDESDIKLMFKHWPVWQARVGIVLKIVFYMSRLIVLVPLLFFFRRLKYQKTFHNHWTGLLGLLSGISIRSRFDA